MMSYVCRQCRARLIQKAPSSRPPQWHSRATFISLRGQPASDANEISAQTHERAPTELPIPHEEPKEEITNPIGKPGRYSGGPRKDELRESAIAAGERASAQRPTTLIKKIKVRMPGNYNSVPFAIDRYCEERNVQKAWEEFVKGCPSSDCPVLAQPDLHDVDLLDGGQVFRRLLDLTVQEFRAGNAAPASPTEVLFKYEQLNIFRFQTLTMNPKARKASMIEAWSYTIGGLTDEILKRIADEEEQQEIDRLLAELLSVWRLLFQRRGAEKSSLDYIDVEWSNIPDAESLASTMKDPTMHRDIRKRLSTLLPHLPKVDCGMSLRYSATILFSIFTSKDWGSLKIAESLQNESAPFVRLMAHVLAGSDLASVQNWYTVLTRYTFPPSFQKMHSANLGRATQDAMTLIGAGTFSNTPGSPEEQAANKEDFLLKRIARATIEQVHKDSLERLWREAVRTYSGQNGTSNVPPAVYNAFLTGFMSLFAADRSVEVWNHMIAHGVNPDVKTWTALLTGSEKARDLNGLNAVWQRMVQSGTQPDKYAWTTRVHGLISLRQISMGFAAMDEMGRQWLSAERSSAPVRKTSSHKSNEGYVKNHNIPKPSVEVINGATSAFVSLPDRSMSFTRKKENVTKILQWAGNFSIKPDARTYNTLIKLYTSGGDFVTTIKLLRQMEGDGIDADLATYNMLIMASFNNLQFEGLPDSEIISGIHDLLSEVEAAGLKLNSHIYSAIVDRLLKQYSNITAARAVIDHMTSRDLIAGPHIYTSVLTHYFQADPPNIEAVDTLWHQIVSTKGTPTDKVLFDRVIEGYAKVGEIGKMMAVLARMSAHGKLPGWPALTAVVSALVRVGDVERARSVVADVRNGEGVAQGGITGGMYGQKRFFAVVERSGILRDGEVEGETLREGEEEIRPEVKEEASGTVIVDEPALSDEIDVGDAARVLQETRAEPEQQKQPGDWWMEDNGTVGGIPL